MFLYLLAIVLCIATIQVILTYQELMPWLRANQRIALQHNKKMISTLTYICKWIGHLPLLMPALFDIGVTMAGTFMGLTGSLIGATATMLAGLVTSLLMKYHRHKRSKQWALELESELGQKGGI